MVHIGSKLLQAEVVESISRQLLDTFTSTNIKVAKGVIAQLLSESEERLLAKRLAAILMLLDEQSYYRIYQILGMSTSTIKSLHGRLLQGEFSEIERCFFHKKEKERTMKLIASLLRCGMPPRTYVIKKRSPL